MTRRPYVKPSVRLVFEFPSSQHSTVVTLPADGVDLARLADPANVEGLKRIGFDVDLSGDVPVLRWRPVSE